MDLPRPQSWLLALTHDVGRTMHTIAALVERLPVAWPVRPVDAPPVQVLAAPPTGRPRRVAVARLRRALLRTGDRLERSRLSVQVRGATVRWRDLVALAEATGLAPAVRTAVARASRHEADPAVIACVDAVLALPEAEREAVVSGLVQRLRRDPVLQHLGSRTTPTAEELDRALLATATSLTQALRELGLDDGEIARLAAISEELTDPITDLVQLYAAPKTLRRKLGRLWRMQRIGLVLMRIVARSRGEAAAAAWAQRAAARE